MYSTVTYLSVRAWVKVGDDAEDTGIGSEN